MSRPAILLPSMCRNTMLAAALQEQQLSSRLPTLVAPIDTIV